MLPGTQVLMIHGIVVRCTHGDDLEVVVAFTFNPDKLWQLGLWSKQNCENCVFRWSWIVGGELGELLTDHLVQTLIRLCALIRAIGNRFTVRALLGIGCEADSASSHVVDEIGWRKLVNDETAKWKSRSRYKI